MVVRCSEIFVRAEPVHLRGSVAVDDITFVVLEVPRYDNQNVTFADPDPFLNFAFDSAKTRYTIRTADPNVIGSKHQLCLSELFPSAFTGKFYADNTSVFCYVLICVFNSTQNIYPCLVDILVLRSDKHACCINP